MCTLLSCSRLYLCFSLFILLSSLVRRRSILLEIRLTTMAEIPGETRRRRRRHNLPNRFNVFFFADRILLHYFVLVRSIVHYARAPNCHAPCVHTLYARVL